MIQTKQELIDYLNSDSKNYKVVAKGWCRYLYHLYSDSISDQWFIWKYIEAMRHVEFHTNNKGLSHFLLRLIWLARLRRYSIKTGFQIPPSTVEKGLTIWHWGAIIVNPAARIGMDCTIYPGVLIGHKDVGQDAPQIGNNVFIGSGAKIIGNIEIGDNVVIGPNSIIVKNVPSNVTVVGSPARIIKKGGAKVDIKL